MGKNKIVLIKPKILKFNHKKGIAEWQNEDEISTAAIKKRF